MKFNERILSTTKEPLRANSIKVLQVNLGYTCNMACKHCHVEAGPARTEMMDENTMKAVLSVLGENDIEIIDITGGAPEINPRFKYLVHEARKLGCRVIVRSNLTIFFEHGMENLPGFYKDNRVEIIASLPYYSEGNVDKLRGSGTFQKSIEALRKLDGLGYGSDSRELKLDLVYNPQGAYLPPYQATLEEEYKRQLSKSFNISFNRLYTFANMPIGRFRNFLVRTKNLEKYMERLRGTFNPETLDGLMCRLLVNVGWDGTLYDCDFNQVLGLPVDDDCPQHIKDFSYSRLSKRIIATDEHCYGCTAGQGST